MYNFIRRWFCYGTRDKVNGVYTLKLQDNKYYVGKSDDIDRRNMGCILMIVVQSWTKKHKVIKRIPNITAAEDGKLGGN